MCSRRFFAFFGIKSVMTVSVSFGQSFLEAYGSECGRYVVKVITSYLMLAIKDE